MDEIYEYPGKWIPVYVNDPAQRETLRAAIEAEGIDVSAPQEPLPSRVIFPKERRDDVIRIAARVGIEVRWPTPTRLVR